ncbi:MAG: hypothetical protein CBC83_02185 [Flavobacteriales bacterium TMED123]|nr:MAG: hypothetical protein CBC83_02185 [Flavobacteriales bacterium TMED123]
MGINTKISNKENAYKATFLLIIIIIVSIILPIFFLQIFPTSTITKTLFSSPWCFLILFGLIVSIYFIFTGVYYFVFEANNYIIEIGSKRTVSSYFSSKSNYIEMPISSIEKFGFFNRPFTFNTILMVKFKVSRRKSIAKRFNFAFLSKKQKDEMISVLQKIIQNNQLNG